MNLYGYQGQGHLITLSKVTQIYILNVFSLEKR